jgi:hypothetical protein
MRNAILAGAAVLLTACASGGAPDAARDAERCVFYFNQYDIATTTFPTEVRSARGGGYSLNPAIQRSIAWLRDGDCLTMNAELDGMAALGESLKPFERVQGGAAMPPIALHAGIVTSTSAEAAAVAFFEGLGYPVRTVGAPQLGRRVFVGPFTTQEAFDQALGVAREAGFASAYGTRRIRF